MPRSQSWARGFHDVRYQTRNVERSLAFYTRLGFSIDYVELPALAQATMGGVTLFLARSDSPPMLRHRGQESEDEKGIVLDVHDLEAHVASMKELGFRFRNEMQEGPDGKRIRLEDPDGNPVELVETTPLWAFDKQHERAGVLGG